MKLFRKGNTVFSFLNNNKLHRNLYHVVCGLYCFIICRNHRSAEPNIPALYNAANRLRLQVNLSKTKVMVFRKGSYLSARERWFYGTERLDVVNTYRYLGLTFSTRLSFRVATDSEHLTRAKRGTIEILKTEEVELFFTRTLLQAL